MKRLWFGLVICLVLSGCKKSADGPQGGSENSEAARQEQSGSIGDWASDTWNGAVSTGSQTVEDTGQWLSNLYKSAKDQGATSASSVKEWVTDDWNAQGDWQYRLISIDANDAQAMEAALNEAGADRWECFHVETTSSPWTFFMKRSRRSYLSRVPLKDLANFLPAISQNEDGQ